MWLQARLRPVCHSPTKVIMFGLSTYISLILAVAMLLAVVVGLPWIRGRVQRRPRDFPQDAVAPLDSVRKRPGTGPRDRNLPQSRT
jgi:hypothetical protein